MSNYEDKAEVTREFYRRQGEQRERERIIKLLETETLDTTAANPNGNYDKLVWAGIREQLIALIKGETE